MFDRSKMLLSTSSKVQQGGKAVAARDTENVNRPVVTVRAKHYAEHIA